MGRVGRGLRVCHDAEEKEKRRSKLTYHPCDLGDIMFSRTGAYHGKGAQAAEDTERRSTSAIDVDRVPLRRRPHIPSLCIAPLVNLPCFGFSFSSREGRFSPTSPNIFKKTNIQSTTSKPVGRPSVRRIVCDGATPAYCKRGGSVSPTALNASPLNGVGNNCSSVNLPSQSALTWIF